MGSLYVFGLPIWEDKDAADERREDKEDRKDLNNQRNDQNNARKLGNNYINEWGKNTRTQATGARAGDAWTGAVEGIVPAVVSSVTSALTANPAGLLGMLGSGGSAAPAEPAVSPWVVGAGGLALGVGVAFLMTRGS